MGIVDDDELIVRASAVLKSQGPENWPRGRPGLNGNCDDDDGLLVRASAVLKSQGPENWSRGRPGE